MKRTCGSAFTHGVYSVCVLRGPGMDMKEEEGDLAVALDLDLEPAAGRPFLFFLATGSGRLIPQLPRAWWDGGVK